MPPSAFALATTPTPDGNLTVGGEWSQGRGAYGGVAAAAMARTMADRLGRPECALRSLTVHCCAPLLPGMAEVSAESIRVGSRVAHMRSEIVQNGEVVVHATASFAAVRTFDMTWNERPMPAVPGPEHLPSIDVSLADGPQFTQFFDYRFCPEHLPLSGGDSARVQIWIRHKDCPIVDMPHLVGLLDAGPPGIITRMTEIRPMASVDFRMQLFQPLPLDGVDPSDPMLFDAHSRVLGEGYAEQIMWLYAPDGRPVGTTQQLIAVLG